MAELAGGLQFQLFGKVSVRAGSGERIEFSNRRVMQLAVLMATEPGERFDRKWIAAQIWPDDALGSALASLRTALSMLRKDLGTLDCVASDRVSIGFDGDVSSDVSQFFQLAKSGRDQEALALVVGSIGPELTGPWADDLRSRVDLEHQRLLAQVSGAEAGRLAANAWRNEPDNEEKLQFALRALVRDGKPAEAVQLFRQFQKHMRDTLGLHPSLETLDLAKHARKLASTPQLLGGSIIPANLPPLIGRESWLDRLRTLLQPASKSRLVTLVGTGGLGKTRLAIETAASLITDYQERVWFVDLSAVTKGEDAVARVCQTVAPEFGGPLDVENLARLLGGPPALLVLDNAEQIDLGFAPLVSTLVQRATHLYVLATSRSPLGVPTETALRLNPLAVAGEGEDPMLAPSVMLFVDRATATAPTFQATDDATMARLSRRLEGLPLAICLAAAKADLLTPEQILTELEDRFNLLNTERKDWPERHRQLWTCIDWSYRMHPECHDLLKTLTAFRGGWTVQTAAWAADAPVHSSLSSLLRASLLVEQYRNGQVRFDMYDSVREFVVAQMTGTELERAGENHATAMAMWLDDSKARNQAFNSGYVTDRRNEYENFRKAFKWSLEKQPAQAVRIANGLAYYWWSLDMAQEGLAWLDSAIAAVPDEPGDDLAMAYRAKATMHTAFSDFPPTFEALDKSLQLLTSDADPLQLAKCHNSVGNALVRIGQFDEALARFETALQYCMKVEGHPIRISVKGNAGFALYLAGKLDEAEAELTSVERELEGGDNSDWHAHFLHHLGLIAKVRGEPARALELFEQSWNLLAEFGIDPADRSWLNDAASALNQLGRSEEAWELLKRSAKGILQVKGKEHLAEAILVASEIKETTGDLAEAAGLLAALIKDGTPVQRSLADQSPTPEERLRSLEGSLGSEPFRRARTRYRGWLLKEIVEAISDEE